MKGEEGKGKEKVFAYITESDGSYALMFSLAESSKSWVIAPLFTPLPDKLFFKTM